MAHDLGDTDICDEVGGESSGDVYSRRHRDLRRTHEVDGAEGNSAEEAGEVNGVAPGMIAGRGSASVRFIHLSTDYVFDGRGHEPYGARVGWFRTCMAERSSMANGGFALRLPWSVVVRTAWVRWGIGANFVRTAARFLTPGKR